MKTLPSETDQTVKETPERPDTGGSGAHTVHAVCSLDCPDSCGVLVTVDTASGRATRVQGDPKHPVTRGFLCGKVAKFLDHVYAPDRLLYPMRRRAGMAKGSLAQGREHEVFERISWRQRLRRSRSGWR